MCGINAIKMFQNTAVTHCQLVAMGNQMIHRGPDDENTWIHGDVGLGFRRLSILDVAHARQPLTNEDGTLALICNGEIYNYLQLREELKAKGHKFKTNGDAETILHLYEEYGTDCTSYLRGMFSFVLYDIEKDIMFAARDPFGIKPFYYWADEEKIICSSELKSIVTLMPEGKSLDPQSLMYYLSFQYVPEPATMVKGVSKLPPGHCMIVKGSQINIKKYWEPSFSPEKQDREILRTTIKEKLEESVKLHMQSDVPIGSFLSSGIDSTAITAMMRKHGNLKTFSVGFEGGQNECEVARVTARMLDTEHHEQMITEEAYFDTVDKVIWHQDDPVADPSAVPLFIVSELASQHVKVVLSGEGADELFGGYRIYQEPQALRYFRKLSPSLKRKALDFVSHAPAFYGKNFLMRGFTPLESRFIGNAKIFTGPALEYLQREKNDSGLMSAFEWAGNYYQEVQEQDEVTKMQHLDMNLWLPGNILAKGDKMSMAHSIELRVPFLDTSVFETARTIPTSLKVNSHTTKKIFREAMEGIVPDHVLHRAKLGFPVPLKQWLRGKRGDMCLSVIASSGISEYIQVGYAEKLVREHQNGKADHARKIWTLYVLAKWHIMYIENAITPLSTGTAETPLIS
ncbi:asparagine synthase (glutamine-hydrolyzing) [Alkalicoccus daliensis]|uniref:asparagine synthase (glutamine-hydrolyzing) n=1 Tax=Alkalicoccus daliensis TaxID=745820 RepID=A0A1H0JDV3_9BACI|nr:asparagine synthase (glutamine-hydrolyzing) [Alkalicoccus daliensis]SDO41762.1 asparagine synthase (glutamine-hydrolysing) [Alkalicoccus daliensis]